MKNIIKYSLYAFLLLVINASLFYFFLSQQKATVTVVTDSVVSATSTLKATMGSRYMTPEERKILNVNPVVKVEVLKRDDKGIPTEYRIIK